MHVNEMANGNYRHFVGVAAGTLRTESTAEVGNMAAQMGRHEDFDVGSWGAVRQEEMLVARRVKFDSYPHLAEQLRDGAGYPLAQVSQGAVTSTMASAWVWFTQSWGWPRGVRISLASGSSCSGRNC